MGRKRKINEVKPHSPIKTRKRAEFAASIALTSSPRRSSKHTKPLLPKKAKKARRRCTLKAPSPNLQTRSRRLASGVDCAHNTVETERIHRLIKEFKDWKTKPCSVFGVDRNVKYRDFFFVKSATTPTQKSSYNQIATGTERATGAYTNALLLIATVFTQPIERKLKYARPTSEEPQRSPEEAPTTHSEQGPSFDNHFRTAGPIEKRLSSSSKLPKGFLSFPFHEKQCLPQGHFEGYH